MVVHSNICTTTRCDLWTNTCGLVGVAHALGWSVMHVQRSVKSVRRKPKRTHYIERIWECECVFKPHRTQSYGRLPRWPRVLFASLGAAVLSRTHRSRSWLHGVEAAFTLCLLLCFHARLLALSSSLPSQLLPFWHRDNETTSTATALRTINLCKCIQLFVNRMFNCIPEWQIAFLSVTNCIPKHDKSHSWAWQITFLSVTNCIPEHDTTPLQPRTRTARLVALR